MRSIPADPVIIPLVNPPQGRIYLRGSAEILLRGGKTPRESGKREVELRKQRKSPRRSEEAE